MAENNECTITTITKLTVLMIKLLRMKSLTETKPITEAVKEIMGIDFPISLLNEVEVVNSNGGSVSSGSTTGSPRAKKHKKSKTNQNNSVNSCFLPDNNSFIKHDNRNQKVMKSSESIIQLSGNKETSGIRETIDNSNPP